MVYRIQGRVAGTGIKRDKDIEEERDRKNEKRVCNVYQKVKNKKNDKECGSESERIVRFMTGFKLFKLNLKPEEKILKMSPWRKT